MGRPGSRVIAKRRSRVRRRSSVASSSISTSITRASMSAGGSLAISWEGAWLALGASGVPPNVVPAILELRAAFSE